MQHLNAPNMHKFMSSRIKEKLTLSVIKLLLDNKNKGQWVETGGKMKVSCTETISYCSGIAFLQSM